MVYESLSLTAIWGFLFCAALVHVKLEIKFVCLFFCSSVFCQLNSQASATEHRRVKGKFFFPNCYFLKLEHFWSQESLAYLWISTKRLFFSSSCCSNAHTFLLMKDMDAQSLFLQVVVVLRLFTMLMCVFSLNPTAPWGLSQVYQYLLN